jgi:hypothetical protein
LACRIPRNSCELAVLDADNASLPEDFALVGIEEFDGVDS